MTWDDSMRLRPPQHRFPDSRTRRRVLLSLVLAWPGVVVIGLWLNRLVGSHAPAAALPTLWLLVLAYVIERTHADSNV
jgi:fatty acid desaturase